MTLREEQIEEVLGREPSGETQPAADTLGEQTTDRAIEEPAAAAPDTAPAEAGGPDIIRAEDTAAMQSKVGVDVLVEGVVKNVGKTGDGGINFINFGDRKTGFTAVVFRSAMAVFPEGLDKYANQTVRVRGTLERYQDRQMQIRITTPDQLEIVDIAP